MPDQWLVVINSPKLMDEIRKFPDDQMSFTAASETVCVSVTVRVESLIHISRCSSQILQSRYTLGHDVVDDPYHISIIKNQLTRNLSVIMPDMIDEIKLACQELLPVQGEGKPIVHVILGLNC